MKEALKLALEALEEPKDHIAKHRRLEAITAIKEALAQPEFLSTNEADIAQLIEERDVREDILDKVLDMVLGIDRPEWSSSYQYIDAVEDVCEALAQLDHPEQMARLGWQYVECPACGSEGARAFPKPEQEPVLQDIEQYRMQIAGICTAAMGYWKEGDSIHPDYDTLALRDVAKLYAKYDELYKAQVQNWQEALAEQQKPFTYYDPVRDAIRPFPSDGDIPLYTTPPQRKPLTVNEVEQILAQHNYDVHGDRARYIVRMTEAAHGIKENT